MPRMEDYHTVPPGIARGWWGTRLGNVIRTPFTLFRPLMLAREGPGAATEHVHGQAELPSKVEPQNPQIAVAPVPTLEFVCINGLPFFYAPLFWRSKHERVH